MPVAPQRKHERRVSPFSHPLKWNNTAVPYPIKTCVACGEEFELKPGKPGFANRCPECSEEDSTDPKSKTSSHTPQSKVDKEANEARREAMRNLLYRKDS